VILDLPEEMGKRFHAVWLANVTGVGGPGRPAYSRIVEESAYDPDDPFVVGWRDEIEADRVEDVPEQMWMLHNADDRPSGRTCRSMCIGDVVLVNLGLGMVAYACETVDFRRLDEVPQHVEVGAYVEYVQAH
jgi:hypothetical protein